MTPRRIYCKICGMSGFSSAEYPHECSGGDYPPELFFITWLHGFHVGRRGPVGDLSREVRIDCMLPLDMVTLEQHLDYFSEAGWHPDTQATVREAWAEWELWKQTGALVIHHE